MKTTERAPAAAAGREAQALIDQARRRQRRRRWVIALAVAAVAAVLAVLAGAGGGTRDRSGGHGGKLPPGAGAAPKLGVRWRAKVPAGVVSMTAAYGSLWVTGIGAVTRMDPASGHLAARIPTPLSGQLPDVASLGGTIWVSSGNPGRRAGVLYQIDPATNRVLRTVPAPGQPSAMTAGGGYLWVDIYHNGLELRPFDPRTTTFLRPVVSTPVAVVMGQPGRPAASVRCGSPPG